MPVSGKQRLPAAVCSVMELLQAVDIQGFYARSCPRRAAQELEAGRYAGVLSEASNFDHLPQCKPSVGADQMIQNHFQRHAMERVVGLWFIHGVSRELLCATRPRLTHQ